MKMTVDPKDCTAKIEVFVSERNCLMRALSILHGLGKMSVAGATDAAVALAKVIDSVETPKQKEAPVPECQKSPIGDSLGSLTSETAAKAVTA